MTGGTKAQCSTIWVIKDGIHSPSVDSLEGESYKNELERVVNHFNSEKGFSKDEAIAPSFVTEHFQW